MTMTVGVDPHPDLELVVFVTQFPQALGALPTPPGVAQALRADAEAPVQRDDAVRRAVRDLLRHGGYKPTGRGKPASEYLVRAAEAGSLAPINVAVDAGNAVALHSGIPVSVVDLERLEAPLRVGLAAAGARYVFNAAGQEIDVGGLLCLHDAVGPCANAVKDAQRTKTTPETRATLTVLWGVQQHADRVRAALDWYHELLAEVPATVEPVGLQPPTSDAGGA